MERKANPMKKTTKTKKPNNKKPNSHDGRDDGEQRETRQTN